MAENKPGLYACELVSVMQRGVREEIASSMGRLYQRLPGLRWRGLVHEELRFEDGKQPAVVQAPGVRIIHHGYNDLDVERRKQYRNIGLLDIMIEAEPTQAVYWFYRGVSKQVLGMNEEALVDLAQAVDMTTPGLNGVMPMWLITAFGIMTSCLANLGAYPQEMEIIKRALGYYGNFAGYYLNAAHALANMGYWHESLAAAKKAGTCTGTPGMTLDTNAGGWKAAMAERHARAAVSRMIRAKV